MREFGFPRFSTIIKTNVKIDIQLSYSHRSEHGVKAPERLKSQKVHFNSSPSDVQLKEAEK